MKKTSSISFILLTLLTLALAGCTSDDVDQAYDLDGIWQGTINGNYYQDHFNSGGSWDTEISFVQEDDYSRSGYGRERDYSHSDGTYNEVGFTWEVRGGVIYMSYDDGYTIIIEDYEIYSTGSTLRFKGTFVDADTREAIASFNLVKTDNWSERPARYVKRPNQVKTKGIIKDEKN